GLAADAGRPVRYQDAPQPDLLDWPGVPEVPAREQLDLLLQGERGERRGDLRVTGGGSHERFLLVIAGIRPRPRSRRFDRSMSSEVMPSPPRTRSAVRRRPMRRPVPRSGP